MPDIFSPARRSEIMSLIKSKDTKPELALRKIVRSHFFKLGYRYRIHYRKLRGTPDVVFVSRKIVLFADGDFWHGYKYKIKRQKLPKKYWRDKIEENMRRDRRVNRELRKDGWTVLRFWEHDVRKNPEKIALRIAKALGIEFD